MDDQIHDNELLMHYNCLWGEPHECHRFLHPAAELLQPLYVYIFADLVDPQTWIYATLGASRQPMTHTKPSREARMELFIMSNQPDEELVQSIGALAIYPFVKNTFLGEGHTIRGDDTDGIVTGSPLTDILIARADFSEGRLDYVYHRDGSHTHLFWVTPVYRSERMYALEHGWRALIDQLEYQQVDIYNLWREAAV